MKVTYCLSILSSLNETRPWHQHLLHYYFFLHQNNPYGHDIFMDNTNYIYILLIYIIYLIKSQICEWDLKWKRAKYTLSCTNKISYFLVLVSILNLTTSREINFSVTDTHAKYVSTHQCHNPEIDGIISLQFTGSLFLTTKVTS